MNGVDKQLVDFARSCFVLAQSRQHGERNMAFFSVVLSLHQSRFKDKRLLRLVSYIELFIHRTFSWTRIESITVAPRPVLYLTFNLPTSQDSIMHYSTFQRNYYLMQFFHVSSSLSTFVHVFSRLFTFVVPLYLRADGFGVLVSFRSKFCSFVIRYHGQEHS